MPDTNPATPAGIDSKQRTKKATPGLKTMKSDGLMKMAANVTSYEMIWDLVSGIDPKVTPDEAAKRAEDLQRGIDALEKFKQALIVRASNRQETKP